MKRVGTMLIYFALILLGVYALLCAYLYFNQRNLVFIPSSSLAATPEMMRLPFEDISVTTPDNVTLHGWYVPSATPSDKVVLFCHGNAGNISHRLETVWMFHQLGINGLYFDYRGYGMSTGQPSEEGVYTDAQTCYDWLIKEKNFLPEQIYIFGRSLGGAIAVDLAANVPAGGLIVESSFTSAKKIAKKIFPYFPINALLKVSFNSLEKIPKVASPVLIAHSIDDEMIPYEMSEQLAAAKDEAIFLAFTGRHNDRKYVQDQKYTDALARFFGVPPVVID